MKKTKADENLGHKWVWDGDVKRCAKCKVYLALWDWKKPCVKPL